MQLPSAWFGVSLRRRPPNGRRPDMLTLGLIRETKTPPDARVPLSPEQCLEARDQMGLPLAVQPSSIRCFSDGEYEALGLPLQEDLSRCDVLLGVKEVQPEELIAGKTYFFFSHTIKKQPHNRRLLQAVLEKKIRLIDYEVLTDDHGNRLVAFGFFAGVVGSHNALWTWGRRTGAFSLPRLYQLHDYAEAISHYKELRLPPLRIVLTGGGRVAAGVLRNLHDLGIRSVSPREFLKHRYDEPVFTQLFAQDYVRHRDKHAGIFNKDHFYAHGEQYESIFMPFAQKADIMINGIFYDSRAPAFFTPAEMATPGFQIRVIADITCDLAPDSSVPSTLRASTLADPVYGFDPVLGAETEPFQPSSIDVMAIDNLPSELPRDASAFFGRQLLDHVIPALKAGGHHPVLERATIAENGHLTPRFSYLESYVTASAH